MKQLLVLGGPTASGKTALAIEWALRHQTEIVSADSRQCYRELHIGVAKPTDEELQTVPHHFINSHSIHDHVTAADYESFGLNTVKQLFEKHDTVICVGGTGLYIKALCEGMDWMPPIQPDIQREVENNYQELGLTWLQDEVKRTDPLFFEQGEIHNPARLIRALSFKRSTGESIVAYRTGEKKQRAFNIQYFMLEPDRSVLYDRINQRVDQMLEQGLLAEVEQLRPFQHLKNLQTVGYQELFPYFSGECSLDESIAKIKQHTRNYAKRQLTWFRNQGHFQKIIN